ncbi:MAG: 5-oxoprolinase subunit PxpB [Bacillota bacterium]
MTDVSPVFHCLSDGALLVTFSDTVSVEVNDLVLRISRAVEAAAVPGIGEVQPAYSSLCVHIDQAAVRPSWVKGLVGQVISRITSEITSGACAGKSQEPSSPDCSPDGGPPAGRRLIEIPVVYGGDKGPDLESSAKELGISQDELIRRHAERDYRVYMVGFTPGFPYLGGMDESIALPRLAKPRARVPAGSVGIGGNQTGVYPWETPGGWRILGRTATSLFDPEKDDPSLLHPGDTVRFVPVDRHLDTSVLAETHLAAGEASAPAPSGGQIGDRAALSGSVKPRVPALLVEHPGFFSTVVDQGRPGFRKLGVPVSGAADLTSYRRANLLAGNAKGEAAVEMTLLGAKFRAVMDCVVAYTGARARLTLDGFEAPMDSPLQMKAGSFLEIGSFTSGCRGYLAVSGGIDVPLVLGSRSTYIRGGFGGYQGRALRAGDVLPAGPAPCSPRSGIPPIPSITPCLDEPCLVLRVRSGPEGEPHLLDALLSGEYTVNPESDRMGLRLTGPEIPVGKGDILSSAVVPGVIEVPADGKPLLLLCDCQTTGGYKRIAVVVREDLPLAGQLRPGARLRFVRAT